MRYRKLDDNFDYQLNTTLQDSPETVGQAILTRLLLWEREWFLNLDEGTPYLRDILGHGTNYDYQIKKRILETPNVTELIDYSSNVDSQRNLTVQCTVATTYGQITVRMPQ